jgi:transcriptional regulator with XRE-family HTH domain
VKTSLTRKVDDFSAAYDIAAFLRERLRAAKGRNSRFSPRSFAKQLGIDHSTLSQVLRNRRRLSARDLQAVGGRIGLSEAAIHAYSENYRKKPNRKSPRKNFRHFDLDLDTFQLLSVWYHYAILELLQVEGFETDSRWIALHWD